MRQIVLIIMAASGIAIWAAGADRGEMITQHHETVSPSVYERKFNVPLFSIEHQVRLSLEARIAWKTLSGSTFWLRVAVNGNYLTARDLLNKRNEFALRNGLDLAWSNADRWRVLYSPDFEAARRQADHPYACPDADPYHYVWDLTPYVQPGENTLRIQHLQALAEPTTLVLRNVKVEVGPAVSPPAAEAVTPAPTGPVPIILAGGPDPVAMQATLYAKGGIELTVAGRTFPLVTRTSLTKGEWYEANLAGEEKQVSTGQSAITSWQAGEYRVKRQVDLRTDHLQVTDTFTNTSEKLVGVIVEHRLGHARPPERAFLAGRETLAECSAARNAYHPSVFAQWKTLGLGLVAEDDVFRVHVQSFAAPEHLGLADDQLGIDAGDSATLEWSVYPTPGGDYWDFVNAVRRNWGSNYTIPGPFCFTMAFRERKPAEWFGQWVRRRDLKIVCGGIAKYADGKYAHGTGITHASQWVDLQRDWTRKMRSAAPQVDVLAYFHAQACTEPGGEDKYADSRLINAKGRHIGYPYRYRIPLYLPTRENSYGQALWRYVETCLDTIGASGLYWDEMSHSVLQFAYQGPWDRRTVIIDPTTHEVIGKRSSVPLLMQPLKLDIVRLLRKDKKFLMANSQPMTRTMLGEQIVRFVETGSYSALINTHFGCPLGLGNHHAEKTHADSARHARRFLDFGCVYYGHGYEREPADWNFTKVMFPITPVEIREGVVLGEERILTARSGRFGWLDNAAADVYVVDAQGARVPEPIVREVRHNGQRLYEVRMPSDHFAVLVKRR